MLNRCNRQVGFDELRSPGARGNTVSALAYNCWVSPTLRRSILSRLVACSDAAVRRSSLNVLIALFLLIAQQAAYTHALSHFDHRAPTTENKQLPHSKACERCGLAAQLGTGLLSQSAAFLSVATYVCTTLHLSRAYHPTAPRRFLSRAPPSLLAN